MMETDRSPVSAVQPAPVRTGWMPPLSPSAIALAVVGAVVIAMGIGVIVKAEDDMPTCPVDSVILAYPRYTRKGLVASHAYRCGQPDRTCRLRGYTAQGPVHDCSPFARKIL